MRNLLRILLVICIGVAVISSTAIAAGARVVCKVDIVTDNTAKVSLSWSDDGSDGGIMITSWRFVDENRLVVYYQTGDQIPEGFSERTISHETYSFPMQVHLQPSAGHSPDFTDLNDSDPGYGQILNLYHRGIINGYPDGSFKAGNQVTRAEFSKMLLLTARYAVNDELNSSFSDVNDSHWGRKYIMTLAQREILKGKGEGRFDPEGQITIGEVLTVLSRTFSLYNSPAKYPYALDVHWSNEYFLDGVKDGLVIRSDHFYHPYDANEKATREDCARLLSRVLESLHDVAE